MPERPGRTRRLLQAAVDVAQRSKLGFLDHSSGRSVGLIVQLRLDVLERAIVGSGHSVLDASVGQQLERHGNTAAV